MSLDKLQRGRDNDGARTHCLRKRAPWGGQSRRPHLSGLAVSHISWRSDMSFRTTPLCCDNERRVGFTADDGGKSVTFHVGFETLERFGTISSPQDALRFLSRTGA